MPKPFPRTRRLGEQLRHEVADLLRHSSDPRFSRVSLTEVVISRDLAYAKAYITFLGAVEERPAVLEALNRQAPWLRHELGRRLHIRMIPRLTFLYDPAVDYGAKMSVLIAEAVATLPPVDTADSSEPHESLNQPASSDRTDAP